MRTVVAAFGMLVALYASAFAADINVFAASSLTDALTEIGEAYRAQSGDRLSFNFAASSTLARQIEEGAPADIFFSAAEAQMDRLAKNGRVLAETRRTLLSNVLVVIAPSDSPLKINSPDELVAAVSRIALADPRIVPAGVYARAYLTHLNLWKAIAPRIIPVENVRAAVAAVISGNVDAGFAYATDVRRSEKVKIIFAIPANEAPRISYPAAVVQGTRHREAAGRFLDFLQSETATKIFESHGFIVPSRK